MLSSSQDSLVNTCKCNAINFHCKKMQTYGPKILQFQYKWVHCALYNLLLMLLLPVSEVFYQFNNCKPTSLSHSFSLFAICDREILTRRLACKRRWRKRYRLVTDVLLLTERTMYRDGSTGWRSSMTLQPTNWQILSF